MKKLLTMLIAVCMICVLTACSKTSGGTGGADDTAPTGNMQKNVPSGGYVSVDGKVIFTYANSNTGGISLLSYDTSDGTVTTFCKDATCTHNSSSCASGGVDSNLESFSGEIYGKSGGGSGKILRLENGRFETVIDSGVSHFFHHGNQLYASTADSSLVVFDGDSKKPRTLLEEYAGYWETVCGGYLYYQFSGVYRLDLSVEGSEPELIVDNVAHITDGEHIYYAKYDDFKLYRCGMDGSEPELLVDWSVLPASWNFDDEYFYFRRYSGDDLMSENSHEVFRLSKADPSNVEKIAELPDPAYQIFTDAESDELFITTLGEDGNPNDIYVVSKTEQTCTRLDIE